MIVLHGTWFDNELCIWAEDSDLISMYSPVGGRRRQRAGSPPHPYAARIVPVMWAVEQLGAPSATDEARDCILVVSLPSDATGPLPSPEALQAAPPHVTRTRHGGAQAALAGWTVPALRIPPVPALEFLTSLIREDDRAVDPLDSNGREANNSPDASGIVGASLRFWSLVADLAVDILDGGYYLPALTVAGRTEVWAEGGADGRVNGMASDMADDSANGRAVRWADPGANRAHRSGAGAGAAAAWEPLLNLEKVRQRVGRLARACPPICMACPEDPMSFDPEALIRGFLRTTIDAFVRENMARAGIRQDLVRLGASMSGWRTEPGPVWLRWAHALIFHHSGITATPSELLKLDEGIRGWTSSLPSARIGGEAFRTCFRLEAPVSSPQDPWAITFHLQASDDPSLLIDADTVWNTTARVSVFADRRLHDPQERLLEDIARASALVPEIGRALADPRPVECELSAGEAYRFLRDGTPLLQRAGFGVLVPAWWKRRQADVRVRVRLRPSSSPADPASRGLMGTEALIDYDWQVSLGDEVLSPEEFRRLAELKVPLVQVRGEWVELRPEDVDAALSNFKKWRSGRMSSRDAIRLALAAGADAGDSEAEDGREDAAPTEVTAEGWIADLLHGLASGARVEPVPTPPEFVGALRPYQSRGLSWLAFLDRYSLGGCLADDMGLGKTIQVIALLLHERTSPTLLICPMSVVENWKHEIARFAPSLRVMVHHGNSRLSGEEFLLRAKETDVVISTYALAYRDRRDLAAVDWERIVLDEAQNVKNHETKQARALKSLPARVRIALTGTPVENHLADLWSIMDFLNPGYLPGITKFREYYAVPIEKHGMENRAEELRRIVQPFILRRVKTDPAIAGDLPDKMETKVFCSLTREQASLYQAIVHDMEHKIETLSGMERRGLIFSTIIRLKQVCNHPAQFLQDRSALAGRSGKLIRLEEMLQEVVDSGDRALVFTQFAEMCELLAPYLEKRLGREILMLHGGTPKPDRDRAVARFQDPSSDTPVFVLSIRAGGVGLNLTAANHVFHFDRWWNPAVEDQATDRAFRIGQHKNVQVHKFICAGTLEERIDRIIEDKKALAQQVIGAGEAWLADLSTEQLRQILELAPSAVMEE